MNTLIIIGIAYYVICIIIILGYDIKEQSKKLFHKPIIKFILGMIPDIIFSFIFVPFLIGISLWNTTER